MDERQEPTKNFEDEEIVSIQSHYPGLDIEKNLIYEKSLLDTLRWHIIRQLDPDNDDIFAKVELTNNAIKVGTGRTDKTKDEISKVVLNQDEQRRYRFLSEILKTLSAMNFEEVLKWAENQNPPIIFTDYERKLFKLYAYRGFHYHMEGLKRKADSEPHKIQ